MKLLVKRRAAGIPTRGLACEPRTYALPVFFHVHQLPKPRRAFPQFIPVISFYLKVKPILCRLFIERGPFDILASFWHSCWGNLLWNVLLSSFTRIKTVINICNRILISVRSESEWWYVCGFSLCHVGRFLSLQVGTKGYDAFVWEQYVTHML